MSEKQRRKQDKRKARKPRQEKRRKERYRCEFKSVEWVRAPDGAITAIHWGFFLRIVFDPLRKTWTWCGAPCGIVPKPEHIFPCASEEEGKRRAFHGLLVHLAAHG